MIVSLKCPRCGAFVTVDARPGRKARCTRCGGKVRVPEALCAFPRPHARPDVPAMRRVAVEGGAEESGRATAVVKRAAPWVISVLFHVGLVLAMIFVVIVFTQAPPGPKSRPAGVLSPQGRRLAGRDVRAAGAAGPSPRFDSPKAAFGDYAGQSADRVIAIGPGGPPADVIGPVRPAGPGGGGKSLGSDPEVVDFIPGPVRADDVVFLIDRSGSMAVGGAFELLKSQLIESIGGLNPDQRFHVIFFGGGREPLELSGGGLVFATEENKLEAHAFLKKVVPVGGTLVLPALARAMAVAQDAAPGETDRTRIIWLLSDGDLEGTPGSTSRYKGLTGGEAVLAWLADHNRADGATDKGAPARTRIQVHTILLRGRDQRAVKVMERIAEDNDGTFAHVEDY